MRAYRSFVALSRFSVINGTTTGFSLQPNISHLIPIQGFYSAPTNFIRLTAVSGTPSGNTTSDKVTSLPNNGPGSTGSGSESFNKYMAFEWIHNLSEHERTSLREALNQYELELLQGEHAANKWHTRLSSTQGVDVMVSDDDGKSIKKSVNGVMRPSRSELYRMMIVNAVPFIGFGFLDNFFMIIAGDYIEHTLGIFMCISTMAAAGLGNTISDVLGLGLAHYVEMLCEFLGLRPPRLTPAQLELTVCRRVSSWGRALGITIGCLLGMFPLMFIKKKASDNEEIKSNATV